MTIKNEKQLLMLVSLGNEQAFREIFDGYRDKLFSYVFRLTNSQELAEEIVMDAFLKIWTGRKELESIEQFDAYLYTIVRTRSFNAIKRMAREAVVIDEFGLWQVESMESTDDIVIFNEYKAILNNAVSQLPPQQQRIYKLKDHGLKYDEIALALNLSKNTVKAHLKKAMSNVRTAFSYYIIYTLYIGFSCFSA